MIRVYIGEFFFILIAATALFADTIIVDIQINYRMYLPNNWVREVKDDTQHFFIDTTFGYPGQLSLKRYTIDTSVYKNPGEWTQAHFTAYKLSVQYSVDPAGVVLYSSADTSVKQGSLWATEIYSIFFSSDTAVGSWAEYVRFTACGGYGYELYAISDTADMSTNIGFYAALLQGIVIAPGDRIITPYEFRRNIYKKEMALSHFLFDPLGREIRAGNAWSASTISRYLSAGVYMRKNGMPKVLLR